MAGRSKYSDEDRAQVSLALAINDGNIKRTARETDMPITTVRQWKKQWELEGVPDAVVAAQVNITDAFVRKAERIENVLLDRIEELAPEVKNIREATVSFGIIHDKRTRAQGLPTNRTEHTTGLPSPEEVRALLGGWMAHTLSAQNEREADIIEVTVVESPKASTGTKSKEIDIVR